MAGPGPVAGPLVEDVVELPPGGAAAGPADVVVGRPVVVVARPVDELGEAPADVGDVGSGPVVPVELPPAPRR
ncbi:MAG TPA: hypothetical protein VG795_08805 [Acidimicrobiia bacterium]|nr:hypothetical protein [Acidimicrobiia bacterium]